MMSKVAIRNRDGCVSGQTQRYDLSLPWMVSQIRGYIPDSLMK
jgi:hypothetical protein